MQAQWERAFATRGGYRPGNELDAAIGIYYNGWSVGANSQIAPQLKLIASDRLHDSGVQADSDNSGYQRLLIAPGMEYDVDSLKLFADVELPIYQDVNGNQLVASRLYKFILSYSY